MVSIRRKILDKGEIVQEQLIRVLQKHEDALGDNATGDTAIAGKVTALETAVGDNSKGLTKKANDLEAAIGDANTEGTILARLKALEDANNSP